MKKRSAYHPRTQSRDLIFRNPIYKAFGKAPMRPDNQVDLKLAAEMAFEAIQKGMATTADRDTLACIVNVAMVMAEMHCSQSDLAIALQAQEALLRADGRALLGKGWNFDGEGRQQIKAALDMHDQQIEQLGRSAVIEALLEMQSRNDKGQLHRIEVPA